MQGVTEGALKLCQGSNFLDIGCFVEKSLDVASRNGFNAYSVDISKKAVKYSKTKDRNIFFGTVEEAKFESSFFSCVIMKHVLEHIPDPKKTTSEVNRVTQKNGIFVINIPTYDALISRIMRHNWMALALYSHFWFFNKNTLNALITKNSDFEVVLIR